MSGSGGAVSAAVITLGLLTGLMLAGPSLDSALRDLKDARRDASDELISVRTTSFSVTDVVLNTTTGVLMVRVLNDGATVIGREEVSVLLNGTMMSFEGPSGGYLYPGERWTLLVKDVEGPGSVRVVGPWGISAQTEEVTRED